MPSEEPAQGAQPEEVVPAAKADPERPVLSVVAESPPAGAPSPESPPRTGGPRDGDPQEDLRRGLKAARRIESTTELVRRARRLAKASKADGRRRARTKLKRLRGVLEALQQGVLRQGLSRAGWHSLKRELDEADDHLDAAIDRKRLKARHLRRLRVHAVRVRRSLEAMHPELVG